MIKPDYHPHADELAELLVRHFGRQAKQALAAMQMVLGNTMFMQVLEAFSYLHATTDDGRKTMRRNEGKRHLVLLLHAARSLNENDIEEVLTWTMEQEQAQAKAAERL